MCLRERRKTEREYVCEKDILENIKNVCVCVCVYWGGGRV